MISDRWRYPCLNLACLTRSKYENEVVKLTIQIDEPTMMMIEKDVSASFTDRLGVVGTIPNCKVK